MKRTILSLLVAGAICPWVANASSEAREHSAHMGLLRHGSGVRHNDSTKPVNSHVVTTPGTHSTPVPPPISKPAPSNISVTHAVAKAPEIDPASAMSALTLLAGSLVVLRGRRKAKR